MDVVYCNARDLDAGAALFRQHYEFVLQYDANAFRKGATVINTRLSTDASAAVTGAFCTHGSNIGVLVLDKPIVFDREPADIAALLQKSEFSEYQLVR